jgi:hypothetical protein
MKTRSSILSTFALMAFALAFVLVSCQKDAMNEGDFPIIQSYPVDISDDVTTVPADATVLDWGMIELSANTTEIEGCDYVYKLDEPVPPDASATIDAPDGFEGEITFIVTGNKIDGYNIQVTDNIDGHTVVINAAFFGVGNFARKFTFDPGVTYAGPLPAPLNPSGNLADISHTHFCYSIIEDNGEECEWIGETAWAANEDEPGELRYNISKNRQGKYIGNWATYVEYTEGEEKTVTLFAGQTMEAGTVEFSAVGDGMVEIKITLNEGWRLEEDDEGEIIPEALKIQGYEESPQGYENPAPGLFTTYKGTELTVTVPAFEYYGVHLNLQWNNCLVEE